MLDTQVPLAKWVPAGQLGGAGFGWLGGGGEGGGAGDAGGEGGGDGDGSGGVGHLRPNGTLLPSRHGLSGIGVDG